MEFLLADSGECPVDTKTTEQELSLLLLPTPNGETFRERPTEPPAGIAMEELNTPLETSPTLLDMLTWPIVTPTMLATQLLDDKTTAETFGLPLLTPNGELFLEKLLERPAGTLMEARNTPPTTSHGSSDMLT